MESAYHVWPASRCWPVLFAPILRPGPGRDIPDRQGKYSAEFGRIHLADLQFPRGSAAPTNVFFRRLFPMFPFRPPEAGDANCPQTLLEGLAPAPSPCPNVSAISPSAHASFASQISGWQNRAVMRLGRFRLPSTERPRLGSTFLCCARPPQHCAFKALHLRVPRGSKTAPSWRCKFFAACLEAKRTFGPFSNTTREPVPPSPARRRSFNSRCCITLNPSFLMNGDVASKIPAP